MRKTKRTGLLTVSLLSGALLLGAYSSNALTGVSKAAPDEALNMTPGTIASNVSFMGDSLSGMTSESAAKLIDKEVDRIKKKTFTLASENYPEHSVSASIADLGVKIDASAAYAALEENTLEGNVYERYLKAKDLQHAPLDLTINTDVSSDKVYGYFLKYQDEWITHAVDAKVSGMSGSVVVTPSQDGLTYDFTAGLDKLIADIKNLDLGEGLVYKINPGEKVEKPNITTERASTFSIIGSWTTNYNAPSDQTSRNREKNLIRSTGLVNGNVFAPGATVSALTMYGKVSLDNGYFTAGTYSNGAHSEEVGGGICQTTSTMYNAVLMAELEVLFRRPHSMLVTYVDPSRDAMVYAAGNSDFQFRNSTSDYLTIEASVNTSDHSVTVILIGKEEHAPGHSVRYESEILEMVMPPINVVEDAEKSIGWENVNTKYSLIGEDGPQPAVKSRLWKVTTDNGVETRTLMNYTDSYRAFPGVYVISPDIKLGFSFGGPRLSAFMIIQPKFLNDTELGSNPATWTDEELIDFNASMKGLMEEKGLAWPYTYTGFQLTSPDCRPGGVPLPEDPSSSDPTDPADPADPTEPPAPEEP